jgi:hypothetical protein
MPLAMPVTPALADTELTVVHELKTLVLSRHGTIAVESAEEERVDALLAEVAHETNLADPAVARAFRELLEQLAAPQRLSTIVLLGPSVELQPGIASDVVRYELRLPGRDSYRRVIGEVVTSLQATGRADVRLATGDYDAFASGLCGLTLNQARQALAQVAIEDGALTPEDLARVVELKASRCARAACSSTSRPRATESSSAASPTCRGGSTGPASPSATRRRSSTFPRQRACCLSASKGAGSRSPRR